MPKDFEKLKENTDRFLGFFRDRLEEIRNLKSEHSTELFKKVLYSSLLDALSKTTAHPKKPNRERIVRFVRDFCDWPNSEKVSLPHLIRLLEKVPDPAFSNLRQYAFSLYDQWGEDETISLDNDLEFQDVKKHWPREIPKPYENVQVEFLQHVNLFYRYRNSLVHELRNLGFGQELSRDREPFYHSSADIESNRKTWELVYPVDFYDGLCEKSVNNLRVYYLNNRIDPYSCYSFGTYWIDELN